ncbi:uncharacterized protein L3040_000055 [Drepanopeziza brunnea f. sp. 'multigermtubi']|uniref:uncharacterized protein n=1 Tax=Drepanopeziza brunnea f. sp. 'multigermtubi' TaxID=698441 RepID=UPI00239B1CB3|nr:hypothetical protein L3040_000055 [Drepanopeziza brunnea f. sp. 'multigermtubi']
MLREYTAHAPGLNYPTNLLKISNEEFDPKQSEEVRGLATDVRTLANLAESEARPWAAVEAAWPAREKARQVANAKNPLPPPGWLVSILRVKDYGEWTIQFSDMDEVGWSHEC